MRPNHQSGFSLLELLIYMGITTVMATLFANILSTATKVQVRQSSSSEVTSQLNLSMQRIQQLVRESSAVIVNDDFSNNDAQTGTTRNVLKLRMKDRLKDPTCVYAELGAIKIAEGASLTDPAQCNFPAARVLTTDAVTVPAGGLVYTKFSSPPGHDLVQINITLQYNTTNPAYSAQRQVTSAATRVSAATFDSNLIPAGTPPLYDLGSSGTQWKSLYLNNYSIVNGQVNEAANYDGGGRGYQVIAIFGATSCTSVCSAHGLQCSTGGVTVANTSIPVTCGQTAVQPEFCFCD